MTLYKKMRNDFSNVLNKLSTSVTYYQVSETYSAGYGTLNKSYADGVSIDVSIQRQDTQWKFDEQGNIEGGDAQMFTLYDQDIAVNDKIVYEGNTYLVKNVLLSRANNGKIIFKKCNLFLYDKE